VQPDNKNDPLPIDISPEPTVSVNSENRSHNLPVESKEPSGDSEALSTASEKTRKEVGATSLQAAGLQGHSTANAKMSHPNLYRALGTTEKDPFGTFRPDASSTLEIATYLARLGGFFEPGSISDKAIEQAISRGKEYVASGEVLNFLGSLGAIDDMDKPSLKGQLPIYFADPQYIKPRYIVGAAAFPDWRGRGYAGTGGVYERLTGRNRQSFDQIVDYASRDTPLPPSVDMTAYLTDRGMFFYSGNSHTTAAAQVRNEPLAVKSLYLVDMRHQQLSGSEQRKVDEAIAVRDHNLLVE